MKSSRRKQTNPNRVSAGTRNLDTVVLPGLTDISSNQEEASNEAIDTMDLSGSSQSSLTNGQNSDFELPLDLHVSVTACSHCSQTFPNSEELQTHKDEMHKAGVKKPRLEVMGENFPTAYHRLGRELQDTTDLPVTNGHPPENETSLVDSCRSLVVSLADSTPLVRDTTDSVPTNMSISEKHVDEMTYSDVTQLPPPVAAPRLSKESNGENGIIGKTDRIFHIDAYCELCDREFCNKYFLKTHKANKHGIYEDSSPPATSVPVPFPGLMMPQEPLTSFNFKMDSMKPSLSEPLLPWSFRLDSPSQQTKKPESLSNSKPAEASLHLFPMTMPHLESIAPSINKMSCNNSSNECIISRSLSSLSNTYTNTTSILTNITNSIKNGPSSNSGQSNNDSSMEDYCHICQKHFCNKYYLRKHKQDVHGIVPENPPSNINKRARSGLLDLPMTSSNPMMLSQSLASFAGIHNLHNMPGLSNMQAMSSMPPGLMVINPYSLPPVAIIPAGSMMNGQQIPHPPPPHTIISQSLGIPPLTEPNLHHSVPPTSVSSSSANSIGQSPVKSSPNGHEIAVHCSICSKEFCNEFYLQIHKESKHGIRRSDEEGLKLSIKDKGTDRTSPSPVPNITKHDMFPAMSRSPLERAPSGEGNVLICNFCNKDFPNKYLYRIHRVHDHGLNEFVNPIHNESNSELPHREHVMNSMNESLMKMAADACAVSYASSYRTSPSNVQQESVICNICNKQIANQHFLRLHKFNCHGKDSDINERYDRRSDSSPVIPASKPKTPPSSGSMISSQNQQPLNLTPLPGKHAMSPFLPPKMDFKEMSTFADFNRDFNRDFKCYRDMPTFLTDTINNELFARSQNQAMHMDLNFFGLPSHGKLPIDDNVKLNFDPEAYCEICKKEFCSKYFLRTHKQNIHGIKSDTTSSSSSKSSDSEKVYTMSSNKPNLNNINGKTNDCIDKNSWRWKEPINSSRVICDICNKEVCNKYFLRTHKQKKHGKHPTSQSPNISMSGSPVASDCDTASNASSQPEDKPYKLDPVNLSQMSPFPHTERVSANLDINTLNFDKEDKDVPFNNNIDQSETCNICNRIFRNMKWLKDHIMKDHTNNEALDMSSKTTTYTCQVCGINFKTELSVQLHLIQEHNARVTLNTEESQIPTEEASLPNSENNNTRVAELCGRWTLRKKVSNHQRLKKYVCNRCGFDSPWLSSLLDHERNEHGFISDEAPTFSCKSCKHLLSSQNSLSAHIVTVHGLNIEDALHEAKIAEATFPNSFKCAHCPAVFPTRSWAMAHVRHVHIRSRRDLAIRNSFAKNLLQCSSCSFRTHFSFRLQRHMKIRHVNSLRSYHRSSHSLHSSSSSVITSNSNYLDACDVQTLNNTPKHDISIPSTCAMYKSIAASLLSAPESDRPKTSTKSADTETLLQSYTLPLCASPVDSPSFNMAIQTSASAVVGL